MLVWSSVCSWSNFFFTCIFVFVFFLFWLDCWLESILCWLYVFIIIYLIYFTRFIIIENISRKVMLKEKDAIKHFVHIDIFDKGLLTKKRRRHLWQVIIIGSYPWVQALIFNKNHSMVKIYVFDWLQIMKYRIFLPRKCTVRVCIYVHNQNWKQRKSQVKNWLRLGIVSRRQPSFLFCMWCIWEVLGYCGQKSTSYHSSLMHVKKE